MPVGLFTDKKHQPTSDEILAVLGPAQAIWWELIEFVEKGLQTRRDFAFYGKNYGWALRFRKSGRALVSLYPGKDGFAVQLVLSESQTGQALGLSLSEDLREVITRAYPFPEGRWVFFKVDTAELLDDVEQLIRVKAGK